MRIARDLGWWPGSRSDETVSDEHRPLYLLDIHWERYDWPAHLRMARRERPALVAVPDILHRNDVPAALDMAAEMAPHGAALLLIPKGRGVIPLLPREVAGTPVVLGYSVPSRYGASPLPLWEYAGWPVHLLGGTPLRQLDAAGYMRAVSADGNMATKLARMGAVFTERGGNAPLRTYAEHPGGPDLAYAAFARSLANIETLWRTAGYAPERCADEGDVRDGG